jgi:hypothetical protein
LAANARNGISKGVLPFLLYNHLVYNRITIQQRYKMPAVILALDVMKISYQMEEIEDDFGLLQVFLTALSNGSDMSMGTSQIALRWRGLNRLKMSASSRKWDFRNHVPSDVCQWPLQSFSLSSGARPAH